MVRRKQARGARILDPFRIAGDVDVPQIDRAGLFRELDGAQPVLVNLHPLGPEQLIDREPAGDGALIAHRVLDRAERVDQQPGAVLEAAAVLVRAVVELVHEELDHDVAVRGIDVDDVEARIARALRSVDVSPRDRRQVLRVRLAGIGLHALVRDRRPGVHRKGHRAGFEVGRAVARIHHLHPRQGAVRMHGIRQMAQVVDVALVPQGGEPGGRAVGIGMDRTRLRAHRAPAALGLHRPVRGLGARLVDARADAVGHLVETVFHHLRADRDRLEQAVVFWIPRHGFSLPRNRSRLVWSRREA